MLLLLLLLLLFFFLFLFIFAASTLERLESEHDDLRQGEVKRMLSTKLQQTDESLRGYMRHKVFLSFKNVLNSEQLRAEFRSRLGDDVWEQILRDVETLVRKHSVFLLALDIVRPTNQQLNKQSRGN